MPDDVSSRQVFCSAQIQSCLAGPSSDLLELMGIPQSVLILFHPDRQTSLAIVQASSLSILGLVVNLLFLALPNVIGDEGGGVNARSAGVAGGCGLDALELGGAGLKYDMMDPVLAALSAEAGLVEVSAVAGQVWVLTVRSTSACVVVYPPSAVSRSLAAVGSEWSLAFTGWVLCERDGKVVIARRRVDGGWKFGRSRFFDATWRHVDAESCRGASLERRRLV